MTREKMKEIIEENVRSFVWDDNNNVYYQVHNIERTHNYIYDCLVNNLKLNDIERISILQTFNNRDKWDTISYKYKIFVSYNKTCMINEITIFENRLKGEYN